jgi:GH18 family chitinase
MEFLYPLTDVRKVTRELRRRNSDLQVLASVGGLRVPTETAEDLVKTADRRAAFASSVALNIRNANLNGIELDFRLEVSGGSKYSKGGLVSLAKVWAHTVKLFVPTFETEMRWISSSVFTSSIQFSK